VEPPSYMQSVIDQDIVLRCIPVLPTETFHDVNKF